MIKKKILYLSWSIPPGHGGSSYITYELSKNFNPDEMVVVGGRLLLSKSGNLDKKFTVKTYYLPTEINIRGHGDRFFRPLRWLMFPYALYKLSQIVKHENVGFILATFPDEYYLSLALKLSHKYNLKLFTYFHNTFVENRPKNEQIKAKKLQDEAFEKSFKVYTMSEGMSDFYNKNYPRFKNKFITLPHTFNSYKQIMATPIDDGFFKFVLIGTFNHSNVDATKRILSVLAGIENISISIYTPINKLVLKHKWDIDLDRMKVNYYPSVTQDEVHNILQKYDACVLTHGFSGGYSQIEYDTIFPTRTIPLLISGRPIIAHSPRGAFLTNFIANENCCLLITEKDESIIENQIRSFIANNYLRDVLIKNALNCSEYFYGPHVVNIFRSNLNK